MTGGKGRQHKKRQAKRQQDREYRKSSGQVKGSNKKTKQKSKRERSDDDSYSSKRNNDNELLDALKRSKYSNDMIDDILKNRDMYDIEYSRSGKVKVFAKF